MPPPSTRSSARARAEGPTLIEAMTFRFFGHVFGDADAYMRKGEKEAAMARDPGAGLPRLADRSTATRRRRELAELEAAIDARDR